MKTYRVFVTGEMDYDFTVDAENENEAADLAEREFENEFTCMRGGYKIGFDSVTAGIIEEEA